MRVGVVMPTLNQAQFIAAALDSYAGQTYKDSELVVVDDGCTDGTQRILEDRNYQVVQHPKNLGTAEAINTGVRVLGPGFDALTWISSDNVMKPRWLATLVEELRKGAGATYGGFRYVFPPEKRRGGFYVFRPHKRNELIDDPGCNCYYGPAFLIRRDVWQPHKGRLAHDYDNWLRVEEECFRRNLPIVGVDQSLCDYNAHDGRATVTRRDEFDAPAFQTEARKRRASA